MNPKWWLHLEGAVELGLLIWLYAGGGSSWYLFAGLFLAPDLSMLGYLAGTRVGAMCYNIAHTYAVTIPIVISGIILRHPLVEAIGLIWSAHVAFDRMIGYGLKYPTSFKSTHLTDIGKRG